MEKKYKFVIFWGFRDQRIVCKHGKLLTKPNQDKGKKSPRREIQIRNRSSIGKISDRAIRLQSAHPTPI